MMKYISIVIFSFVIFNTEAYAENNTAQDYMALYDEDSKSYCDQIKDPFEPLNRKILNFNIFLDAIFLRPISLAYGKVTPQPVKKMVINFFDNLHLTNVFAQSLLQGKLKNSLVTFWRFTINSTLGIGGMFDIASKIGLDPTRESLGDTLAFYGMPPGPYLILPIFGPTTIRDAGNFAITYYEIFNPPYRELPKFYYSSLKSLDMISKREQSEALLISLSKSSTDFYSSMKSLYWQKRENIVNYPSYSKCYKKQPNK